MVGLKGAVLWRNEISLTEGLDAAMQRPRRVCWFVVSSLLLLLCSHTQFGFHHLHELLVISQVPLSTFLSGSKPLLTRYMALDLITDMPVGLS